MVISCFNDEDVELKTDKTITATLGVPVAHGSFKLKTIIPEEDNIKPVGKDAVYHIVLDELDPVGVEFKTANEVIKNINIPPVELKPNVAALNAVGAPILADIPLPSEDKNIDIASDDANIKSVVFDGGFLAVSVIVPADNYEIKLSVGNFNFDFTNAGATSQQIDLTGRSLDFQNLKFSVSGKIKAGGTINSNPLTFSCQFINPSFKTVYGDFSSLNIETSNLESEIPVELPDFEDYQDIFDNVYIKNIPIKLNYKSTLGVSSSLNFKVQKQVKDKASFEDLVSSTINIAKSTTPGDLIEDSEVVMINELGLNLEKIKFGDVNLNIGSGANDFITFPLKLEMTPVLEIPLNLVMDNVEYSFFTSLSDIDEDSNIDRGQLRFSYNNGLDLNLKLKAYLMKADKRIDSVDVVDEKTNQKSDFLSKGEGSVIVDMKGDFAKNLSLADSLEFSLILSTLDGDQLKPLTIDTTTSFDIDVKAVVQGTIELDKDDE